MAAKAALRPRQIAARSAASAATDDVDRARRTRRAPRPASGSFVDARSSCPSSLDDQAASPPGGWSWRATAACGGLDRGPYPSSRSPRARDAAAIVSETAAPASSVCGNPASSVRTVSGTRSTRSVSSVAIPSVPSLPTIRCPVRPGSFVPAERSTSGHLGDDLGGEDVVDGAAVFHATGAARILGAMLPPIVHRPGCADGSGG